MIIKEIVIEKSQNHKIAVTIRHLFIFESVHKREKYYIIKVYTSIIYII